MDKRKVYTLGEFEHGKVEAVMAYSKYRNLKEDYKNIKNNKNLTNHVFGYTLESSKEELNKSVEKCEELLPSYLVEHLNIKKIE